MANLDSFDLSTNANARRKNKIKFSQLMMTRTSGCWRWIFYYTALVYLITSTGLVDAQQQSFRRTPENVEVKLGDTAVLRCEVENQAGRVQWTKNGFALGYNRSIPGYERYTMVGDGDRGVHNLRIVNVSLSDIAEYQCQVGPSSQAQNKPIRSNAMLNVLVPPKSVRILNYAPDATIILKEKEQTELECIVSESRPAAEIVWYKNGALYRPETREESYDEIEYTEERILVKKNTTRSKIKILPNAEDDRAKFACEAKHPAITSHQNRRVSVVLSVQYPPGAPRIDGYNEGDNIRENQTVTLICISRGGNPLAELVWFKNDIPVLQTYMKKEEIKESRSALTIHATMSENLARIRCEAKNSISRSPKIADVVLSVLFPPKSVKISGPSEVKIGEHITLSCNSSDSNPRVQIAWFIAGVEYKDFSISSYSTGNGGWTTISNVSYTVGINDSKVPFTCQAVNSALGETRSHTHTINVVRPPGKPNVYKQYQTIKAGTNQRLTCTTNGGFPIPQLTWYRAGKKIPSTQRDDGYMVTSEVSFDANMTDNLINYKCEAKNKALTTAYFEQTNFTVYFAPQSAILTYKPNKPKAGQKVTLKCESSVSNPPAIVSIYQHDSTQPISNSSDQVFTDSSYGGQKTSIEYKFQLNADHDGAIYACEAKNSEIGLSVHTKVKLDVLYKPKYTDTAGEKVSVTEGDSSVITVQAKGNPDKITYKWFKNGSEIKTQSKINVNGSTLNFTSATKKDKGTYEVEASNSEGKTKLEIDLDVKYSPTVRPFADFVMINQNDAAHLECSIDANPLDESMIEWKFGPTNTTLVAGTRDTQRKFMDGKAYLTLPNVTIGDAGEYFCIVNNGVGQAANSSIFLIVKHKPDIDKSPQIAKAASNKNGVGKLICRAKGAPNVTFSWNRKDGVSINGSTSSTSSKYSISTKALDRMTFESTLQIFHVDTDDYGFYTCIAHNEIDDDTHDIKLDVLSRPDPPVGFRVVNASDQSITLTWDPGFDGGYEQSYRIYYDEVGKNNKKTVDARNVTVFTVFPLSTGTEYSFQIKSYNKIGESNATTEIVKQETSSVGKTTTTNPDEDFSPSPFSKLVISVFIVVGATMLLINILLIACFIKRRTKKRLNSGASEQGSSKSATIEMYAPSSYNETVTGETLSSISEKSATYSHGENHDEYIDDGGGKGTGVSTYLVEHINHHSSGYPYQQDMTTGGNGGGVGLRASTLPRQPRQHLPLEIARHAEDDGYVDAMRRNSYNQVGPGDNVVMYGRTTPRSFSSRPPQVPPIPELYNIPPEARYVPYPPSGFGVPTQMGNGTLRHSSSSHEHLHNHVPPPDVSYHPHHPHTQHQHPNGRLLTTATSPRSPQRGSVLTTFVPNPSPNLEHEGHLV